MIATVSIEPTLRFPVRGNTPIVPLIPFSLVNAIETIVIQGARQHNLKNISLSLPRNQLVVITGLSGSGKTTLAFDTLYAEGQRRYVESLSHLCASVSRAFAKTRCGSDRRAFSGDCHRTENRHPQSPVHGGDGNRNL